MNVESIRQHLKFPVSIGDRVYTTGDICNPSGWAVVKTIRITKWGVSLEVAFDEETLSGPNASTVAHECWIEMLAFTGRRNKYDRWQTEAEYNAYRAAAIRENGG